MTNKSSLIDHACVEVMSGTIWSMLPEEICIFETQTITFHSGLILVQATFV